MQLDLIFYFFLFNSNVNNQDNSQAALNCLHRVSPVNELVQICKSVKVANGLFQLDNGLMYEQSKVGRVSCSSRSGDVVCMQQKHSLIKLLVWLKTQSFKMTCNKTASRQRRQTCFRHEGEFT